MAFVTTVSPDLYSTTSNLEEIPAGADPLQYADDAKMNQILVGLTALHGWASGVPVSETANGHYLGLASGSSAAVSVAGGVRIRQDAGALDYSYNTGAYARLLSKLTLASQATGDIMYASAADTWTRLAAGTNGHVLTLSGGVPTWAAGGGGGLSSPVGAADGGTGQAGGYAIGDMLYASGASAISKLAAVATGQVLASAGVTTAPAYTATPTLTTLGLAAGSTAACSLYATGDPNTGVYFPAADQIAIVSGGSARVIIDGSTELHSLIQTGPAGSAALPTYGFTGDPNTGAYNIGADQYGITAGGTLRASFNTTQQTFYTDALIQETNAATTGIVDALTVRLRSTGTAAANLYTRALFQMHDDAGTDRDAGSLSWGWDDAGAATPDSSGYLHAMVAGTLTSVLAFNNNGIVTNAGSAATPAHRFNSDDNSGMYSAGADVLGFATNGTLRLSVSAIEVTSTLPYVAPAGSAGTPSLTFTGDTNTGFYSSAADEISTTIGGTQRHKLGTAARWKFGAAALEDAYLVEVCTDAAGASNSMRSTSASGVAYYYAKADDVNAGAFFAHYGSSNADTFCGGSNTNSSWLKAIGGHLSIGTNTASKNLYLGANNVEFIQCVASGAVKLGRALAENMATSLAAANNLAPDLVGSTAIVTGNTQINLIDTTGRQAGSVLRLVFTGTPTVKHGQATSGANQMIRLSGSVDLVAAAHTVLTLVNDGTQWQEIGRKVA